MVVLTLERGTCYVVVAMRNMFVKGELPGETPSPSAGSDISSFNQLYDYVQDVFDKCSNPEVNKPGWYAAGKASLFLSHTLTSFPTNQPPLTPSLRLRLWDGLTDWWLFQVT